MSSPLNPFQEIAFQIPQSPYWETSAKCEQFIGDWLVELPINRAAQQDSLIAMAAHLPPREILLLKERTLELINDRVGEVDDELKERCTAIPSQSHHLILNVLCSAVVGGALALGASAKKRSEGFQATLVISAIAFAILYLHAVWSNFRLLRTENPDLGDILLLEAQTLDESIVILNTLFGIFAGSKDGDLEQRVRDLNLQNSSQQKRIDSLERQRAGARRLHKQQFEQYEQQLLATRSTQLPDSVEMGVETPRDQNTSEVGQKTPSPMGTSDSGQNTPFSAHQVDVSDAESHTPEKSPDPMGVDEGVLSLVAPDLTSNPGEQLPRAHRNPSVNFIDPPSDRSDAVDSADTAWTQREPFSENSQNATDKQLPIKGIDDSAIISPGPESDQMASRGGLDLPRPSLNFSQWAVGSDVAGFNSGSN